MENIGRHDPSTARPRLPARTGRAGVVVHAATVAALSGLLAGCGGSPTALPANAPAALAQSEAIARVGDVTVRANALQTSTLQESVARAYGIPRDDGTILLLVAVRRGAGADAASMPARIDASATDLSGHRHDIAMRELRIDDPGSSTGQALIDHVGTIDISLPETLRFDVRIVREGGATSTMQFDREFFPR